MTTSIQYLKITCAIFAIFLPFHALGQFNPDNLQSDSSILVPEYQKFGIRFSSIGFFKNNEYFHPLIDGYTLPGFIVQPRLYYQAGDKFGLDIGIHLSQYSGRRGLNQCEPIFRATYQPSTNFSILLGWLKGTQEHQLIEPLFQWERMYTQPLEYGAQFIYNTNKFKMDTWINWDKYIELNDPFQEELFFGLNQKVLLMHKNGFEIWVPLQVTIKHQGGQINSNKSIPLKTIANWAPGIKGSYITNQQVFRSLNFEFYYIGFNDLSPQKKQAFTNGFGLYPILSASIDQFSTSLGFWYGQHFISSKGEPLFQSVSETKPLSILPNRQVITLKIAYNKTIYQNIKFGAYYETYLDTKLGQSDYDYGISMIIGGDFKLKTWR